MKKYLCLLMALFLTISTEIIVFAGITNEQLEELINLEIMDDENGDLRLGDKITKAELAKALCVVGNIDVSIPVESGDFHDVPKNHWAYTYIMATKRKGIINGDDNGFFRPDDSVTYQEVVKMVLSLLGYDAKADFKGGYPTGYLVVANEIGIINGLQFNRDDDAARGDVALILLNAVDVPLMIDIGQGDNRNYVSLNGYGGKNKVTLRDKIPENKLVEPMVRGFVTLEKANGTYIKIDNKLYERGFRASSIELYEYNNELYTLFNATTDGYINENDSLNYLIALCTGFYSINEVENPYLDGKISLSYNPDFKVINEKTYVSISEYIVTTLCKKGNLELGLPKVKQAEFNNDGVKFVRDIDGRWYVNLNEFMNYFQVNVTVDVKKDGDISYIKSVDCEKYMFVTNGGTHVPSVDGEVSESPITEKANNKFLGWYDNEMLTGEPITFPYAGTCKILYAKWTPLPHTTLTITPRTNFDLIDIELFDIDEGCTVIFAAYRDGKLVNIQNDTYRGGTVSFIESNDYDTAKVMVWDVLSKLKPLCNVTEQTFENK